MERNILVDKLKGYACFLVLFGHVIMGIRQAGIATPQFFWGLEKFIWSFHVALFMFLSGAVYKMTGEWRSKKTKVGFIKNKLISLGIPYIIFSAVYILINSLVGQTNTQSSVSDILFIWKTPVAQYWFLYALLFLFIIWTIFSGLMKNWIITMLMVIIAYTVPLLGGNFGPFDIVFYSALAFGLGTFINFESLVTPKWWVKCTVVILHLITGILLVNFNKIEAPLFKEFMVVFGIYSSVIFISLIHNFKLVSKFLLFMNKYSFQTYLLHTIFTAGIRIVLIKVGINQWLIHILAGTMCGIAFSVLASVVAEKIKFLNFFFFPAKAFKKNTKTP